MTLKASKSLWDFWSSNMNIHRVHREAVYWHALENKDDLKKWEDILCA